MPFAYYERLSARRKKIYRASDAIAELPLPDATALISGVEALRRALEAEDARAVGRASGALANDLCAQLGAPRVRVRVLAARPADDYGELHGLYEPEPPPARITLWMRTAAKRRVVAFRSFLRTLVHELLHHVDYEVFQFEETFHTEGFFQRESSVARQLLGETPASPSGSASRRG